MRRRAAAVAVLLALGACGGDDGGGAGDVLADAEDHLSEVRSGRMALTMTASTGEGEDGAGPVGFRIEGPFSFESGGDLPVLDLTYTRILRDEEELTLGSDGDQAWVVRDGEVTDVPDDQLAALRLGDGDQAGVPELELGAWVEDAAVEERGGDAVVTGELDVVEMLEDLQRLVAEVEGGAAGEPMDDGEAERLRSLVRQSRVEVVTVGDEHRLRSLAASVDFGGDVPAELQDALGAYAAARLELTLTLEELDGELDVDRPTGF